MAGPTIATHLEDFGDAERIADAVVHLRYALTRLEPVTFDLTVMRLVVGMIESGTVYLEGVLKDKGGGDGS